MDARPKSNKQKRLEKKRRLELRAERQQREDASAATADRVAVADRVLKDAKALRHDPKQLLRLVSRGESVRVPLTSGLHAIARLFAGINSSKTHGYPLRPDLAALRRLVLLCHERTDLLDGQTASQYASALLALSAHTGSWLRQPEDWEPRSHNAYKQFHALTRHLLARYDVPTFLNSAWLEGLTPRGVIHQGWFLLVGQGRNIRTARGLPIPLTKKQAHLYLGAPDDFDAVSALRWAQVRDLGGDERLVRSILGTQAGADFAHDDFWTTVFRWLIDQPLLDPAHHGPLIDYLADQRYVASVPNSEAHLPGRPLRVPPQPGLTMKGRNPVTLLRAVEQWHRRLGRERNARVTCWPPAGFAPFHRVEGQGETRRVFTITELLTASALLEEGRAMSHCVGTYGESCASGRVSIWSLRVTDAWGQEERLLTLEVTNLNRQILQARRRHNKLPSPRELTLLKRWSDAGGPTLSKWLAR